MFNHKFLWNFVVYCAKNEESEEVARVARGEIRSAYKIVLDLAVELKGNGHFISMDNFFKSVELFEKLASMQIYATSLVETNQIGLPLTLKNTRAFKNVLQRTLDWRMYKSRKMLCVV
jgi:hypothetical protein